MRILETSAVMTVTSSQVGDCRCARGTYIQAEGPRQVASIEGGSTESKRSILGDRMMGRLSSSDVQGEARRHLR
jgi:hypothetical protein